MREWIKSNIGIELTDDKEILADEDMKKQNGNICTEN